MATAIKVENLSKVYRLGEIGTGTISKDIERYVITKILKKADPFLSIGETNDRKNKSSNNIVYSLKDIDFEINQGEAIGIIGKNGAGKSTLLKLLSRVTSPTKGKINIKGRIASLLEVGTGFHPELTGRENIYLNGAILGMRKKEIDNKFDEIVDFSGVERYIDTPVKRYSSGMYVRLAFAVAAHLESEILIVDEVLAVGDAEFQKKCIGKMGDISKGEGRTILFVSHNMSSIQNMCSKSILLKNGEIKEFGATDKVISTYIFENNDKKNKDLSTITERSGNQKFKILDSYFCQNKSRSNKLFSLTETNLIIEYELFDLNTTTKNIRIDVGINDMYGTRVGWFSTWNKNFIIDKYSKRVTFEITNFNLAPGEYDCNLFIGYDNEVADFIQNVNGFSIIDSDYYSTGKVLPPNQGYLLFNYEIHNK